jgi:HPt (histidine-containing phosphotransfer) domain-containing protein
LKGKVNILAGWIERKESGTGTVDASRRDPDEGAEPDLPESLPGIDIESALDRLLGRPALLKKLIRQSHRVYGGAAREIGKAIEEGDLKAAERLAHSVKGLAGNLSANELNVVAGELEMAIIRGQKEDLAGLLGRFQGALDKISESAKILEQRQVERLREESNAKEARSDEGGKPAGYRTPDLSVVVPLFHELDHFLDEGNFKAGECFGSLRRHLEGCGLQAEIEQLDNCITTFDRDRGREILACIAQSFNVSFVSQGASSQVSNLKADEG